MDGAAAPMEPELIRDELVERAAQLLPDLAELVRLFYRYVPLEEIVDDDPAELAGAVRSHHALARERVPGRPVVRVFDPDQSGAGSRVPGTVVQVVTDDMPYLVESVAAEMVRNGLHVNRLIHRHVVVRRDISGRLAEVLATADPNDPPSGALAELWLSIRTDGVMAADWFRELENGLISVLHDVREVVEDTDRMTGTALALADQLETEPPLVAGEEVSDAAGLLRWLANEHFIFLGYRYYELVSGDDGPALRAVLSSGLGILRQDSLAVRSLFAPDDGMPQAGLSLLVLTEASSPATVYRSVYPYYVGVKTFDDNGTVTGEHRFLGTFNAYARYAPVLEIPVVRHKVREVIRRTGFPLESYTGQGMLDVMQDWPRSELFSTNVDLLYQTVTGVVELADHRRLRAFLRRDPYHRFYSCLVFLPSDRYTTHSRLAMQEVLLAELAGTHLMFSASIGETPLARVHFTVYTDSTRPVEPDAAHIQELLTQAVRTWDDRMVEAVVEELQLSAAADGQPANGFGVDSGTEEGLRAAAMFPESYKEDFSAADGLADLLRLRRLRGPDPFDVSFYVPMSDSSAERRLKLYLTGAGASLSQMLPLLQRLGVEVTDQRPYALGYDERYWIYDFGLRIDPHLLSGLSTEEHASLRSRFQDAFAAVWRGDAESDPLNALVLRAGLTWEQVAVLRMYTRYLFQVAMSYSQEYIDDALLAHPRLATALVNLFLARFDPATPDPHRAARQSRSLAEVESLLGDVRASDERAILRRLCTLVKATTRTNYFVRDERGQPRVYLAIKLAPRDTAEWPRPRPWSETFVCSPRVEGVLLRFGPVARGGIALSDRREDYRSEVMGLISATALENAMVVPAVAQGGFVLKRPPASVGDSMDARYVEGIAGYRMFLSGLLDLADNRVDGTVRTRPDVVRYDGDDPYLAVAAGRGTRTFADIANEVAAGYGFWIGDAFASGGAAGYDPKAMGIAARGTWEGVRLHFGELELDPRTDRFTVVGIGDMSSDRFGNGMLASPHTLLVAAFDGRHIFLDPHPDPVSGFAERRRLFDLPRSSWADYDRSLISEGGGVWPVTATSIPISPDAATALGLPHADASLTPQELVRAILTAPVALLWIASSGVYVKSAMETNATIQDKAAEAVRVNANELRARIIGEARQGLTQRARIDFATAGGMINIATVDGSAAADFSDREVNIKILLDHLSDAERAELLARHGDAVVESVLADNYRRLAGLTVDRLQALAQSGAHEDVIVALTADGGLDPSIEPLPAWVAVDSPTSVREGLTRPHLADLGCRTKIWLRSRLSELCRTGSLSWKAADYFPADLRERFRDAILEHPLRDDIAASSMANELVDVAGPGFVHRLAEETNASVDDIVRAFAVSSTVFEIPLVWQEIRRLEGTVPMAARTSMLVQLRELVVRTARWLLSRRPQPLDITAECAYFEQVSALIPHVTGWLQGALAAESSATSNGLQLFGVPLELAERIGSALPSCHLLDVSDLAGRSGRATHSSGVDGVRAELYSAGKLYYTVFHRIGVDQLLENLGRRERSRKLDELAALAVTDQLCGIVRDISANLLTRIESRDDPGRVVDDWIEVNRPALRRAQATVSKGAGGADLSGLFVAAQALSSLSSASSAPRAHPG